MRIRAGGIAVAVTIAAIAGAQPARATMPPRWGAFPAPVRDAIAAGLLDLPAPASPDARAAARAAASGVPRVWRVPVILTSYSDDPLVYAGADFNRTLFDTTGSTPTGSVYDYYQWASVGHLRVVPTVVATVRLRNPRAYYGYLSWGLSSNWPYNDAGLVDDALQICTRSVDWTSFDADHDGYVDILWVVHAGIGGEGSRDPNDLWSVNSELTEYWGPFNPGTFDATVPGGPHILINRFSMLPEQSFFAPGQLCEIGVYCHEFGHVLGLPDLYDTTDPLGHNTGPGNWSLMSTGAYGGDGISPQYPSHPGAWCSLALGWSQSFRPAQDTLITLQPLPRGGSVLELWFQGESNPEHFLVECRRREGFDRRLPNDGLIVYHVNEAAIVARIGSNTVNRSPDPAMIIVEADGRRDLLVGADHGDSTDCFPGAFGRTLLDDGPVPPSTVSFRGAPTSLALRDITPVGGVFSCKAQVRAPGWQPALDQGDSDYNPTGNFGPASTAVIDARGDIASVSSELRGSRAQVILRERVSGRWQPAFAVSHSSADALDPSIALLPGQDLAVVWSDKRSGRARVYYRARIRGQWIDEQPLTDLPGDGVTPAIGADARGTVQVAWSYVMGGRSQILLTRFAYLSPFGQARAVTAPANSPGAPALAVAPDGSSYIVWSDQGTNPATVRFARFLPDFGVGPQQPLTNPVGVTQRAPCATADAAGAVHTTWLVSGPGFTQIHYQRRLPNGGAAPYDTTLEVEGGSIQNPRLISDPQGGLHLVFQNLGARVSQIRYKRSQPDRGWDQLSTEITLPSDGSAQRPVVLPTAPGVVTVLYTGYPDGLPHFMERQRLFDRPALPAVLRASPAGPAIALGPNPLRAGQSLRLAWAGGLPGPDAEVEFYDLAGRRVAAVRCSGLAPGTTGVRAEGGSGLILDPAVTASWPAGVYFARVREARQPAARLVYLR